MSRFNQNFSSIDNNSLAFQTADMNGRIDLLSDLPELDIPEYQRRSVNNTNYTNEAIYGQITPTNLSNLFFSEMNIEALQQGIRYKVYVETNGKYTIGRQSDQELKLVMRSIYYQYALNLNTDCVTQVKELNAKVLDWCVKEVKSNLLQFQIYRQDVSTMPMPLDRSPLITNKGTRVLEIKRFI